MKYTKKIEQLDAIQWEGTNLADLEALAEGTGTSFKIEGELLIMVEPDNEWTIHGGYYLIKREDESIWSCSEEYFLKTYEVV